MELSINIMISLEVGNIWWEVPMEEADMVHTA